MTNYSLNDLTHDDRAFLESFVYETATAIVADVLSRQDGWAPDERVRKLARSTAMAAIEAVFVLDVIKARREPAGTKLEDAQKRAETNAMMVFLAVRQRSHHEPV